MNQDLQNLRLLSIFHYVLAGIIALFACIPFIHLILGIIFLVMPESFCNGDCEDVPPPFVGWIFIGIGTLAIVMGWALAIAVGIAGRFLSQRRRLKYCMVVAGLSCLFMPLGTVLGVFTLIQLSKPHMAELFASGPKSGEGQ